MVVFTIGRVIIGFLAAWLIVIILLSGPMFHNNEPEEQILVRLSRALGELEALKLQNEELKSLLNSLQLSSSSEKNEKLISLSLKDNLKTKEGTFMQEQSGKNVMMREPSKEFEETRRLIEDGVLEMGYYLNAELKKLNVSLGADKSKKVSLLMEDANNYKRVLLSNLNKFKNLDGLNKWREKEARELGDIVQKRLHYLQNPKDCSSAKKLLCNLNKGCGYGCQIHHAVYCFIVAYGTKRTLILRSNNWRYASKGWESVFLPISDTCKDDSGSSRATWPGSDSTQVVDLPIIDNVRPRPIYLPLAIPKDLSERIVRLHGNPVVWWISQFVKYLLRPQEFMKTLLEKVEEKMDIVHPVVGIHVRRTDKIGTEAQFHSIEEYMEHVEDYFRLLELKSSVDKRRVYLATDDPTLLAESRKKYPDYIFYGDPDVAKSASVGQRYSTESLKGVIIDIHMLSKCDYLVCTFSSQVCRLAYEIMQNFHPDASSYFRSLDDIFYFGGQNDHNQLAIFNHTARNSNEISMVKGDIVGIAGNHWDGYSKGLNRRTKKSGLYPSYKTIEKLDLVDFPIYSEADEH
ncbi:alpha-(1,6)-fucosyltransferase [Parasteatoda tepidariorum]|uniref:alpha-(1,6)-fucosyltransferase n=1 Tax=Parasteatoda tepidariorum TaxID=114398 RepID=UPI00077FE4B0|nr:alpha-(1,6)-fucosyltransferase [Parasteatoda tepidariorum]